MRVLIGLIDARTSLEERAEIEKHLRQLGYDDFEWQKVGKYYTGEEWIEAWKLFGEKPSSSK